LDVWDISHNQNEVQYSHKVSDAALTSISIEGNTQNGGKLVAVGDANGLVSLLEVCDSLALPQHNEKALVNTIFERETKREKNLEGRAREQRRAKAQEKANESSGDGATKNEDSDVMLRAVEKEFFDVVSIED
jgi:dynein intermediate chain 2